MDIAQQLSRVLEAAEALSYFKYREPGLQKALDSVRALMRNAQTPD